MTRLEAPIVRVVLYEGPGSKILTNESRVAAVRALLDRGYAVSSIRTSEPAAVAPNSILLVLGDFEQEPEVDHPGVRFQRLNGAPEEAAKYADAVREEFALERPGTWKPWFPVIDYKRCTNCMQCLNFCLFDVYGVKNGKIDVRNRDNCKTDCPACSRVCPEVAIMFPKYRHGPINGDEVSSDDVRREAMKVDISALLGGDIYALLRDRSEKARSRFSKERDSERAMKERLNCLQKAGQALGVPADVFVSALEAVITNGEPKQP
ncbi:MAG: ferredoxin family protein [Bryobacterales bacterium]|nr:ferredoxin family protein [Bryobacterales bacterium]